MSKPEQKKLLRRKIQADKQSVAFKDRMEHSALIASSIEQSEIFRNLSSMFLRAIACVTI